MLLMSTPRPATNRIEHERMLLAHDAIRIGTTFIPHADPHVKQDRDLGM